MLHSDKSKWDVGNQMCAADWAALGKAQKEKSLWGLKDRHDIPDQNCCFIASLSRGLMVLEAFCTLRSQPHLMLQP